MATRSPIPASPRKVIGLAPLATANLLISNLSRNFQLGKHLGLGLTLENAKEKVGQVAEGVRTLEVIKEESTSLNINMPLVDSLHDIIYKGASAKILIDDLVNNPHEVDVEFTY